MKPPPHLATRAKAKYSTTKEAHFKHSAFFPHQQKVRSGASTIFNLMLLKWCKVSKLTAPVFKLPFLA